MTQNKRQHWIPDSYLRSWVDPIKPEGHNDFVNLFSKSGSDHRRRSPHKIFRMPDLYTIVSDGQRDLSIERLFSQIEKAFCRARDQVTKGRSLDAKGAAALYAFVAAMMVRSPYSIEHFAKQFRHISLKAKSVRISPDHKSLPIFPSSGHSMSIEEFSKMAEDPMGTWFSEAYDGHLDVLSELFSCDILRNVSPYPLLTSDKPAVVSFAEKEQQSWPRGLGSLGCAITMPISPICALKFQHGPPGMNKEVMLSWEDVFEINCHTIASSNSTIVSCWPDLFFVQAYLDHANI